VSEPKRVLTVELPGLTVGALEWGPQDGPLALCLHGFPDTAWTWRRVAPMLAAEGWRVVAPFSRGYAPTAVPSNGRYQVGALVRDAVGLAAALGADRRAVLVGHDWGALTAYGVGDFAPEAFHRIVTLSVPPLATLRRVLGRSLEQPSALLLGLKQLRSSWYMVANQVPGAAELAFEPLVRKLWHDWSPGYDATDDLEHLAAALPDVAHRSAAVRYYRAAFQPWERRTEFDKEQAAIYRVPIAPTLYLHGEQDGCVRPEIGAQAEPDLVTGSRVQMVPDAGHFVQLEQPNVVGEAILDFIR
jgi:pimeloyl-ACP methyl ester carboxylesterase